MQPRDPKAPPPDLNLPVFMGPMNIPQMPPPKRKRRWKLFLLWSVGTFAGGVAAGPFLIDQACALVEQATKMVGMSVPRFVAERKAAPHGEASPRPSDKAIAVASETPPAPSAEPAEQPASAQAAAPATAPTVAAPPAAAPTPAAPPSATSPVAVKPSIVPTPPTPEPEPAAPTRAPRGSKAGHGAVASARNESAEPPESPATHSQHGKGGAKPLTTSGSGKRRGADYQDPFAGDDDGAGAAKPAAPSGKAKPVASEPAPAAKSEPAHKPVARSNDPLDNLMADGIGDSKGKKRESKDLDALLKDVQKSKPEPVKVKREEPPPASALSPADISRVMGGVKIRASECARRLGQKGNAELKISVSKEGTVTDVKVGGAVADSPLGACIDKATRAAKFPASSGLKFDYRIEAR